jgi:hypothetical protein
MFRRFLVPGVLTGAVFLMAAAVLAVPPRDSRIVRDAALENKTVPVLVELFTPEGCNGCAVADELLSKLEEQQPSQGAEVVILDEHLDFASGWREPQSARAMTNRQIDYGRLFRNDNIFEPQMIIGGRTQLLGAEIAKVKDEIAREAKTQKASVSVSFQSASVASVKIDKVPDDVGLCDVWMAITESNLETPPTDTSAKRLKHSGVVRSLVLLGRVDSSGPSSFSMHLRFNPRWKRDDLKYVVFVQDRISRRIWGATAVAP